MPGRKQPLELRARRGDERLPVAVREHLNSLLDHRIHREPPPPPHGLRKMGKEAWAELWDTAPWIVESDARAVESYCRMVDERQYLHTSRAKVAADDYQTKIKFTQQLRLLEETMHVVRTSLGLSPVSRTSMGYEQVKAVHEKAKIIDDAEKAAEAAERWNASPAATIEVLKPAVASE